jgi:hypothetical protein
MAAESGAVGFEEISRAADGFQKAGIFGIGFDFFTQAADADIHTARGDNLFAAPDGGEEFFASEDAARVGGKLIEEAEFEEAGGDGFVSAGDEIGVAIDAQIVELENLLELGVGFSAPEKKFDAGEKFAWAERLGDVIVGAGFEGGDEVVFTTAGGEHDDGQALKQRVLAGFGEKLEAGAAGKDGVEEEDVGRELFQGGAAGEAVGSVDDLETGFFEFVADEHNNVGVVLDDENTLHREPCVGKQWGNCTASGETEGIKD